MGRDAARFLVPREEQHALLRELHEKRFEPELVPQARAEAGDGLKVARGLARHGLQLPAVRHHDGRAAVPCVVAALRVDERGNPLRARRLEEGGREGRRERALRVVGEKEHVGGVHRPPRHGEELPLC